MFATREIGSPPDFVWDVLRRVDDIAAWIPVVASARLDGDIRRVDFHDGGGATERIVEIDDDQRRYTYEYLDGVLPLAFYRSTLAVSTGDGGSTVTWHAEFRGRTEDDEAALQEQLGEIYAESLDRLAQTCEGRPPG